jgi:hypothetical protein
MHKNKIALILIPIIVCGLLNSQAIAEDAVQVIDLKVDGGNLKKGTDDESIKNLELNREIEFIVPDKCKNPEIETTFNTTEKKTIELSNSNKYSIPPKAQGVINKYKKYNAIIKCNGFPNPLIIDNIGSNYAKAEIDKISIDAKKYLENNTILKDLGEIRYDGDSAYLFLDEKGELIGGLPVNVDEDDNIYIYIAVNDDPDLYKIEMVGGEYSPVDVAIRSGELPVSAQAKGLPEEWSFIKKQFGPYTSDNVTFNIQKKEDDKLTTLNSYKIKINDLINVNIGVSIVASTLTKPGFDLFTLEGEKKTINTINTGNQTFTTLNATWYIWPTIYSLKNFIFGGNITKGRDILKEPNFFERFNPTFGVSLDKNFNENIFLGLVFEFARGGSITGGWHYGKFNKLGDKKFELGKTEFNGTKADIVLSEDWGWGMYLGINLDTRIFNKLLGK